MQLTTSRIRKTRKPTDECCLACQRHLTSDDRVFITPEGELFCSVKCAEWWAKAGGAQ